MQRLFPISALLSILCFTACTPHAIQPAHVEAPHLYYIHTTDALRFLRRSHPETKDGYLTRDPAHTALVFHEYAYTPTPRSFQIDSGNITPLQSTPPPLTPPANLLKNSPGRAEDEAPKFFDDTNTLVATWSPSEKKVRLRKNVPPFPIQFELHSETPPQSLFTLPSHLYLVLGPQTAYRLDNAALGTRPDPPRRLVILREAPSLHIESDRLVAASMILDVDPWSDQILAEDAIFLGYSLPFGNPIYHHNRFLLDLKTNKRTNLPAMSGPNYHPTAYFLGSNPLP
jgi:hypothetical protein